MNSKILFCKDIRMDRGYKNVLNYSESQMLELCTSQNHLVAQRLDFNVINSESGEIIRVDLPYNDVVTCNYIAFQNPAYSSKWFFAWIDEIRMRSNNMIEVSFTVDAWSTWRSYWNQLPCYVVREHVNDDTIGLHTLDEGLDVGNIVQIASYTEGSSTLYYLGVLSSFRPEGSQDLEYSNISVYNGQVFANQLLIFNTATTTPPNGYLDFAQFLLRATTSTTSSIADVHDVFWIPYSLIDASDLNQHTFTSGSDTYRYYTLKYNYNAKTFNFNVPKQYGAFGGYTPKNNKCFCYPYNYLQVTNNNGNINNYKYELFADTTNATFDVEQALSVGISGRLVPKNYKNMSIADDEAIPQGKFPTCSWTADSYTNWLTQQAINVPTQIASIATNVATGLVGLNNTTMDSKNQLGNTISFGGNLASQIGGFIGQFYSAELMPNVTQGGNTGDVLFSAKRNVFVGRCMRCRKENIQVIDDYFSRFGYKINRVKNANITGRESWNYVEIGTGEVIGYGRVPTIYMNQINNACRSGVTIWHNHENIGNFSLSNNIS